MKTPLDVFGFTGWESKAQQLLSSPWGNNYVLSEMNNNKTEDTVSSDTKVENGDQP